MPSQLARTLSRLSSRAKRGICFFFAIMLGAIFVCAAPRPPSRPRILGIAAVHLYSTNIAAARDFYSKSLNPGRLCAWCEEVPREPLAIPLNSHQVVIINSSPEPTPPNLVAEVSFTVDNLGELSKYFAAQKIQATPKLTTDQHWDMITMAYSALLVTDPEGRRITFIGRANALPQSGSAATSATTDALHLIHAGFIVHDRAATEHFYKDILGFRPYWHGGMKDDQTDWVSMQVPDGTDWLEFMVNVSPDADRRVRGIMNHIAIGVTDIHATEQRLRDTGLKLTEEPHIGRGGKWQLNVYDPDGTRIEFMEFKPVQKPCCSEYTGPHPGPPR
jgi:catechol 2,3-dioxygenase-like lactoylglutathione lyase family enzyme